MKRLWVIGVMLAVALNPSHGQQVCTGAYLCLGKSSLGISHYMECTPEGLTTGPILSCGDKRNECIQGRNTTQRACVNLSGVYCHNSAVGKFVMPSERELCDIYMECVFDEFDHDNQYINMVPRVTACPPGQEFNVLTETCTPPEEAGCSIPQPGNNTDGSVSCQRFEKYPNTTDCSRYVVCNNRGISTSVSCPPGLLFDEYSRGCGTNVRCGKRPVLNFPVVPPPTPEECQGVYMCLDNFRYMVCPTRDFPYSPIYECDPTKQCVPGGNIVETACITTAWCTEKQNYAMPPDFNNNNQIRNCDQYKTCNNGTSGVAQVARCPSGLEYSAYENTCTSPETADCSIFNYALPYLRNQNNWCTSGYPVYYYHKTPDVNNCGRYVICTGRGRVISIPCPDGLLFDAATRKCVTSTNCRRRPHPDDITTTVTTPFYYSTSSTGGSTPYTETTPDPGSTPDFVTEPTSINPFTDTTTKQWTSTSDTTTTTDKTVSFTDTTTPCIIETTPAPNTEEPLLPIARCEEGSAYRCLPWNASFFQACHEGITRRDVLSCGLVWSEASVCYPRQGTIGSACRAPPPECREEGKFLLPEGGCELYYACTLTELGTLEQTVRACPRGLEFSPPVQRCLPPSEAACSTPTTPAPCVPSSRRPDPAHCGRYILCDSRGKHVVRDCIGNLKYDEDKLKCTIDANCGKRPHPKA